MKVLSYSGREAQEKFRSLGWEGGRWENFFEDRGASSKMGFFDVRSLPSLSSKNLPSSSNKLFILSSVRSLDHSLRPKIEDDFVFRTEKMEDGSDVWVKKVENGFVLKAEKAPKIVEPPHLRRSFSIFE